MIFSYASEGSGSRRAVGRLALALGGEAAVDSSVRIWPCLVTARDLRTRIRRYQLPWQEDMKWRVLLLRKTKKALYRLFGGGGLHSSAIIKTGFLKGHLADESDIVVANWFGDYTDSIEELGKVGVPLVLRNGDMWWFQGSKHFVDPSGIPTSRWQGFLEWLFFRKEDTDTLARKKSTFTRWCLRQCRQVRG